MGAFSYDEAAGAIYVHITKEKVVLTKEVYPNRVFLDMDENDELVGIEILLPKDVNIDLFSFSGENDITDADTEIDFDGRLGI